MAPTRTVSASPARNESKNKFVHCARGYTEEGSRWEKGGNASHDASFHSLSPSSSRDSRESSKLDQPTHQDKPSSKHLPCRELTMRYHRTAVGEKAKRKEGGINEKKPEEKCLAD